MPKTLEMVQLVYLDSIGILASLANKLIMRQAMPSLQQILFWDRRIIPISTFIDSCLYFRWGKSVLGIWCKL
jgi:hypothetical protein